MEFQSEKELVRAFHRALDAATPAEVAAVASEHMRADCLWRGYHPFNEQIGPKAMSEAFWVPLKSSFAALARREDIFFAGANEMDGFSSRWVVSMGHMVGLFDQPWLGIPATGRMTFLRYASFCRVEDGQITDIAMFIDIPHVMLQAGLRPFAPSRGAEVIHPGPVGHDGLCYGPHPEAEGRATLEAVNAMICDLGQWNLGLPLEEELARTWHDDMIWWGPTGIGATYTIERYAKQHSGPFRATFSDRTKTNHVARLAEGHFAGFFGWPNFQARLTGDYMGRAATGEIGEFRVIDIYRRRGDKLAENWVFIDFLHFWKCHGVDILAEALS